MFSSINKVFSVNYIKRLDTFCQINVYHTNYAVLKLSYSSFA